MPHIILGASVIHFLMVSKEIKTDLVCKKITIQFSFFTPGVAHVQLFYLGYSGINKILESLLTDDTAVSGYKSFII